MRLPFFGTVLFECQDQNTYSEAAGLCYPCGPHSDEDEILDFYKPICGDNLSTTTEEFLLECFHFGTLTTSECPGSTTSEDELTSSEDEFTTSEDESTSSEDESTSSEDEFTSSEDESTSSEDEFTSSEDEATSSEDEFTTSEDELLTTTEEDPTPPIEEDPTPTGPTNTDNSGAFSARTSCMTGLAATLYVILLSSATLGRMLA